MINEITNLFLTLILIFLIPYFHEYGHYIYAKKYGFNIKIIWSKTKLYPVAVSGDYDVSDEHFCFKRCQITIMGILFGLIPIIIFCFIVDLNYIRIITAIYLIGICYKDNLIILDSLKR